MDEKNKVVLYISLVIIVGLSVIYFSYSFFNANNIDPLTGHAVAQGGTTQKLATQKASNPTIGIIKGTTDFIITDNGVTVDTVAAENTVMYFTTSGNNIADYLKVKLSSNNAKYKGAVNNLDADDQDQRCSSNPYTTKQNYYDNNTNGIEDQGEFIVYTVTTDSSGCYGTKLPAGTYDIFI